MGSWSAVAFITIINFLAADRSLESMCSESAQPSIQLALVLAGQFLKFCGHAICCNNPH